MDFSGGPADQVVQKICVTGQPDATQLDAAGLHVTDVVRGPIPVTAVVTERRNGDGSVADQRRPDQGDARRSTPWPGPSRPAIAATATRHIADVARPADQDRPHRGARRWPAADRIGELHRRPVRSVLLDSIRLGRTEGRGTIRLAPAKPVAVVLQGEPDRPVGETDRENPATTEPAHRQRRRRPGHSTPGSTARSWRMASRPAICWSPPPATAARSACSTLIGSTTGRTAGSRSRSRHERASGICMSMPRMPAHSCAGWTPYGRCDPAG